VLSSRLRPLAATFEHLSEECRTVSHDPVDSEGEQFIHLHLIVDRPEVDRKLFFMSSPQKALIDQSNLSCMGRNLQAIARGK
jgi:hypothetical protein